MCKCGVIVTPKGLNPVGTNPAGPMAAIIFAAIAVTLADELGYSPDGGLVSFG